MSSNKNILRATRLFTPWRIRINQFIFYLQLWKWAAMHSEQFKNFRFYCFEYFSISFISFSGYRNTNRLLSIYINLSPSLFSFYIPPQAEYDFLKAREHLH